MFSSDIGHLDAEGYLTISGRIKEMIIRGGENIYPREIEEYVLLHDSIEDVHVRFAFLVCLLQPLAYRAVMLPRIWHNAEG